MARIQLLRDVIRALPEEFRKRFAREIDGGAKRHDGLVCDPAAIWPRLQALDVETATRADVIAALGGEAMASWVWLDCEACKRQVEAVVSIDIYSSENEDARLCRDCCAEALAMFTASP